MKLEQLEEPIAEHPPAEPITDADMAVEQHARSTERFTRASHWGAALLASIIGLAALSVGLWSANLLWSTFQRNDWLGWLAVALLATAICAALILLSREIIGLLRLRSLRRIRRLAEAARATGDVKAEKTATRALAKTLSSRKDLAWGLARFHEHATDLRDPGELLTLAERELLRPLDRQSQHLIVSSARRVSIVTAVSPTGFLSMAFVLYENLRMLRALATLYGGTPGLVGSFKIARMVFLHILATGGIALTDDLLGQFIGQDLLRRLSRRLGEGVFNGALTARIGVAAISVVRPLPFIETHPPRLRSLLAELFRPSRQTTAKT